MGRLAPEITTVSNPKIKPARAATMDDVKILLLLMSNRCLVKKGMKNKHMFNKR